MLATLITFDGFVKQIETVDNHQPIRIAQTLGRNQYYWDQMEPDMRAQPQYRVREFERQGNTTVYQER